MPAKQHGETRSGPSDDTLAARLLDADPAQRRRAAIELGKTGKARHVDALAAALKRESDDPACASIILALGAIGGFEAIAALNAARPLGEMSRAAMRKARGHAGAVRGAAAWKDALTLDRVYLEVPEGLERPCLLLLKQSGWSDVTPERPGLLEVGNGVPAALISPPPRWCYRPRLLLGESDNDADAALQSLIRAAAAAAPWAGWLDIEGDGAFTYRIDVEGRSLDKPSFARLLRTCRSVLEPIGALDSPSSYLAELVFSFAAGGVRLYFRPSFHEDARFAYRRRDVGAAMNPVVAAALARLAPAGLSGAVIDPTCGSAVPLIERALFDSAADRLVGLDVSAVAIEAATTNIAAAGFAERASLLKTDARDKSAWRPCGLVIANLPYGLRIKTPKPELRALYTGILRRAEEFLTPDGRVILATAYKDGLERALATTSALRTLARYRVSTGGLVVQIAVLGRDGTQARRRKP